MPDASIASCLPFPHSPSRLSPALKVTYPLRSFASLCLPLLPIASQYQRGVPHLKVTDPGPPHGLAMPTSASHCPPVLSIASESQWVFLATRVNQLSTSRCLPRATLLAPLFLFEAYGGTMFLAEARGYFASLELLILELLVLMSRIVEIALQTCWCVVLKRVVIFCV